MGVVPLANMFTQANINNALKSAVIKGISLGYENILAKRSGNPFDCDELLCAMALGESLKGFIPESTIVGGLQATFTFSAVNLGISSTTFTLSVTSGYVLASYSLIVTGSATNCAILICDYINSHSPLYTAVPSGAQVTIYGTNYDLDNGTLWDGGNADDSLTVHGTMQKGEPVVYQKNNCITDEEAESILEVLNKIISPCEPLDENLNSAII